MLVSLGAMAVAGCESAVLVNNRPEREPNWEQRSTPTAAEPETASGTVAADESGGVDVAATTRPSADQTVKTKDVRIESQSN